MALLYCDHNFIASAHDGPNDYKDHLISLTRSGTVSYVLSTWHWLEMARDRDAARGLSVASFADSLTPRWFLERRSVQRREVEHAFFEFLWLPPRRQSVIGTLAEAIADLTGASLQAASHYRDSAAFVRHMQTLGEDHPLQVPSVRVSKHRDKTARVTGQVASPMRWSSVWTKLPSGISCPPRRQLVFSSTQIARTGSSNPAITISFLASQSKPCIAWTVGEQGES